MGSVNIGSRTAYINNVALTLDVPAEIKNDRTFIPLRFVSEALGANVDYEAETQTVTVLLIDTDGWNEFNDPNGGHIIYPADWTKSGDTDSELVLTGPTGSEIRVRVVQDEIEEIADNLWSDYDSRGFELFSEDLLNSENPDEGLFLSFIDTDGSNMAFVIISAESDGTYVYEIESDISIILIDLELLDKIFLTEEDYTEWKAGQS